MGNRRVFLRPVFLLLAAFSSALAQNQQVYVAVGDKITLHLNPPASAEITRVAWFHENNRLGVWADGEFSFFGTFKGRTTIDSTTGSLEIQNTGKSDSGSYEVKYNFDLVQRYDVRVIRKVPKPSIWITPAACSPSSGRCRLLCDAKTDESEPVTYSWREEDGGWKEGTNTSDIGNETERIKTFTCWIRNPVSEEMSKPIENPFFKKPLVPETSGNVRLGVLLGVGLSVLAVVVAGVVFWKRDPHHEGHQSTFRSRWWIFWRWTKESGIEGEKASHRKCVGRPASGPQDHPPAPAIRPSSTVTPSTQEPRCSDPDGTAQ